MRCNRAGVHAETGHHVERLKDLMDGHMLLRLIGQGEARCRIYLSLREMGLPECEMLGAEVDKFGVV